MPLIFIFVVGIAIALMRRRLLAVPAEGVLSSDAPARLVGWAASLLSAPRGDWGQAMIGELDRLEGRTRRWRFALGCVGAAVIMPPWGRAVAALAALMAMAASAGGLVVYIYRRYHLSTDGWTWFWAAVLGAVAVGYVLGGSALLRRPKVAGPGLLGGLLLGAAWVVTSGVTFTPWLNAVQRNWWLPFLAPIGVGAGATLWSRSAAIGRRVARLAAISAGLGVYAYGLLAVAVIGAAGNPHDDGWTEAMVVADRLGDQAVFYLLALPLMAATLGWAAAAATARLRGYPPEDGASSHPAPTGAGSVVVTATRQRRTWYALTICAGAAATVLLVLLTLLH
jgi:hypothetical protein